MRGVRRLARSAAAVLVVAAGLAACAGDDGDGDDSRSPSFLYVQQAEQATFQPAGGDVPDSYTLMLQNVAPRTVYFSDRPDRVSGSLATEAFVRLETLFSPDDPPNAAVVISEPQGEDEDVVIVELREPRYEQETRTFSYEALVIDEVSEGLRNWEQRQDQSLPARVGHLSLYIDSTVTTDCPGQVSWDNGTVVVTVTDDKTGQPLPGAEVQLFGTSDPDVPDYSGTTDGSGQLRLSVIPSDALIQDYYRTVITIEGYVTLQENVTVCPDQTVKVTADLDPE
jgi:hypothetical protein